jgi:hypothetical protein
LVGKAVAKELIFTGRKIGGRDAMSMGMYDQVLLCLSLYIYYQGILVSPSSQEVPWAVLQAVVAYHVEAKPRSTKLIPDPIPH